MNSSRCAFLILSLRGIAAALASAAPTTVLPAFDAPLAATVMLCSNPVHGRGPPEARPLCPC